MSTNRITIYGNVLFRLACGDGVKRIFGKTKKQLKNKTFRISEDKLKRLMREDVRDIAGFIRVTFDDCSFMYGYIKDPNYYYNVVEEDVVDYCNGIDNLYDIANWVDYVPDGGTYSVQFKKQLMIATVKLVNIEERIIEFAIHGIDWKLLSHDMKCGHIEDY